MPAGPRPTAPLLDTSEEPEALPPPALPSAGGARRTALTLVSFGFKCGRPPANHYFDVSFLENPAREEGWSHWSSAGEEMRAWVLVEELARRLRAEGLDVAVHHREHEFARAAEDVA